MVDRVAQDRNETEDYSMKNEMENGQEPQENGEKPRCTAIILAAGMPCMRWRNPGLLMTVFW